MAPKKKGKGKGKGKQKKPKEPKPPKPTKTQWLARIAERNAVLAAARKRIQTIEDVYFATEKRYEQTQEDMADILQYLRHEIEENELEIAEYDEKIAMCKEEIRKLDEYYGAIFASLEAKYEEKEQELKNKIEVNEAKLSAFEEVRQQREEYLKKKEELYRKLQEMQAQYQKELYEAEKAAIIKQDTLQKEMETNLTKLAVDFRQATDIAIGETTNKLIRDNIALGNKLTCMQEIIEKARTAYHKARDVEKDYRYNTELLEEEHNLLQDKHNRQVNIIDNLVRNLEELNEKIRISQRLFKDNRRLQRQIAEKECILKEKKADLEDFLRTLKECQNTFDLVKALFTSLKRGVIKLEMALFETVATVKEGIDIENMMHMKEDEEQVEAPVETSKEELEETLAEFKFKTRETSIDEALSKLSKGLLTESELQLTTQSSDYFPVNENSTVLSQPEEVAENGNEPSTD